MSSKPGSKVKSELLDNLYIGAPCSVSWDSMTGDERARACSQCSRKVYNLSDMTKNEAETFLQENGVSHCVTFYRRQDGTIMTDNCPVGLRKLRDQCKFAMRVAAASIAFLMTPLAGFAKPVHKGKTVDCKQSNQSPMPMVDGKPAMLPRTGNMPDIAGGAVFMPPVPGQAVILPYKKPVRPIISSPENVTINNPGNSTKEKPGTDPYYKLRAEFTELADPTAFNMYTLGQQNLAQGRVLVAKAYFKAALKAFNPANHDWRLKQLVEEELKRVEEMPISESEKENEGTVVKIEFEGGKPRIIQSQPAIQE